MSVRDAVREFHLAVGHVVRDRPQLGGLSPEEKRFRERLILEEIAELVCALRGLEDPGCLVEAFERAIDRHSRHRPPANGSGDGRLEIEAVADALADSVYLHYGTALVYGVNLDAVLDEVHRSNMSKLSANGGASHRADGKVLKGTEYRTPDIARVLDDQVAV